MISGKNHTPNSKAIQTTDSSEESVRNDIVGFELPKANNFLVIRYLFAFTIVINHFAALNQFSWTSPPLSYYIVEGFFIISGFLVFQSYIRHPQPKEFYIRRLRRLMPAYIGVVLFGLLLGLSLSELSFKQFFSNRDTWRYVGANLLTVNFLQPTLPGVFTHNPMEAVNGALWTVKVELLLYLTVPLIYYLCRRYSYKGILCIVYILSFLYSESMLYLFEKTGQPIYDILHRQGPGQLNFFYGGAVVYLYFRILKKYRYLLGGVSLLILLLPDSFLFRFLFPISWSVLIIECAYFIHHFSFIDRITNLSYGIYLYHFPIIQAFIALGLSQYNEFLALTAILSLATLCAWVSWYTLERNSYHPEYLHSIRET